MTAAQTIKTPVMVLPPRRGCADPLADMQALARRLRRISLGEIVTGVPCVPRGLRLFVIIADYEALEPGQAPRSPSVCISS